MSEWFWKLLNLEKDMFQGDCTWQVRFADLWLNPVVLGISALALVALVFFLYRRESTGIPAGTRIVLVGLRLLVILALLAAVFSPALFLKIEKKDRSQVLLLLDESSSMLLKDNYQKADAEGVAAALKSAGEDVNPSALAGMERVNIAAKLAARLRNRIIDRKDFGVSVYGFGERLRVIDDGTQEKGRKQIVPNASGNSTEIGTALSQLLGQFRGENLSAVVILSDGCNNAGTVPSSAADLAREQRVPIYVMGIGNPKHPKDIYVANLLVNDTLLVDDAADFVADIQAWGYDNEDADIQLFERPEGGEFKEVARQTVKLLPEGKRLPVRLEYTPHEPGEKMYKVEIKVRPDEARTDNNSESTAVTVVEGKLRVLYVASEPIWEYRVLSRALIQDKMIHTACWLQSADPQFTQDGDESIDKLPDDASALVRREKAETADPKAAPAADVDPKKKKKEYTGFDVVMLSGLDPADVSEKFTQAVLSFVRDHGGGLLFMAGQKNTPHSLINSRAADLLASLPVDIEDKYDTSNFGKRLFNEEFHLRLTPEGAAMRLTQVGQTPKESSELWEKNLPGFYWYYPVKRAKPGAVVIAAHDRDKDLATRMRGKDARPMPVIASHFFGKGRVMFVGIDSTWRWRKDVGDKYFYKFWSQSLHYLGKGSLLKKLGGVTISTDKPEYVVGETTTIRAKVIEEASLEPSSKESFTAVIEKSAQGAKAETLKLTATDERGWYEGTWKTRETGTHHIWLQMDGRKPEEKPGLHRFDVELPAREKGDVKMDEKVLVSLVTPGGMLFRPADLARFEDIPASIKPAGETRIIQRTQTIWDSAAFLTLLILLLGIEWILRKKKGLL